MHYWDDAASYLEEVGRSATGCELGSTALPYTAIAYYSLMLCYPVGANNS